MPNAADIIDLVTEHEESPRNLRDRFEEDYGLYLLDQRLPPEPDDAVEDSNEGYRIYTSNEPMTFADKIMGLISAGNLQIRTPAHDDQMSDREADDICERFLIGAFDAADHRLLEMIQAPVLESASFYVTLRGWIAGRFLIGKNAEDETFVDITPWDPLNTFWGMGSDGLAWACHRTTKSRADIKAQFGKTIKADDPDDQEKSVTVYDYYDSKFNYIVADGGVMLKKKTRHGSPTVPVVIVATPSAPQISSSDRDDDDARYGESIYKANRSLYESHNLIMSIMLELVARARKPPIDVHSRDGTKTLDDDPFREGSMVSTADGESVRAMELLETTRDTGAFLGIVSGEVQRGALPHTIFGELQFQLSGFAISTLRQGLESVIQPRIKAVNNFYRLGASLLRSQYTSGAFENLRLTGTDRQKNYFDEEIEPDAVKMGGIPQITLKSELPQDDTSKMAVAQMAREGPVPLMADEWIRDNYLQLQDADLIDNQIKVQQAERGLPEAQLYVLMISAEKQGRSDLAQFYYSQLLQLMFQKQMQGFMSEQQMQAQVAAAQGGGGPPGIDPRALPNAALGGPPPAPTPQAGPNVPPGSPRPGSQQQLAQLG